MARSSSKIVGVVFTLVGFGMLAGGIYAGMDRKAFLEDAKEVPGTIVGERSHSDSDGTTYSAVYSYTYAGAVRTAEASVSSSGHPNVGEQVMLHVDPDDPDHVVADTFMENWFIAVFFSAMGLVFTTVGVLALGIGAIRRKRRDAPQAYEPLGAPDEPAPTTSVDQRGPFL